MKDELIRLLRLFDKKLGNDEQSRKQVLSIVYLCRCNYKQLCAANNIQRVKKVRHRVSDSSGNLQ